MLLKRIRLILTLLVFTVALSIEWAYTCSPSVNIEHVYMSWEEFRAPVTIQEPRTLELLGNLLVYGDYLLMLEQEDGVHVIDNSNPEAPDTIGFLPVPGASQLALRGDYLYVKSYTDIVVIDFSVPESSAEVSRLELVFDHHYDDDLGVSVEEKITHSAGSCGGGGCAAGGSAAPGNPQPQTAAAGSMAAMLIVDDYLYAIDRRHIHTFDISDLMNPEFKTEVPVQAVPETLYHHEEALYLGTRTGVFIYELSDPSWPQLAGTFTHQRQCDPVVVKGDVAFSTLRSGTGCGGASNQLDILDVSDIQSPQLIESYALFNPHGLAIDDNLLFIADGLEGMKVYEYQHPADLQSLGQLNTFNDMEEDWRIYALDIILDDGHGYLLGSTGLIQFRYTDLGEIEVISNMLTGIYIE